MKLIRQNDESGGLALTQNLAGKARKQNYNYEKGFSTQSQTGNPYIYLPIAKTPTDTYSIGMFSKPRGSFNNSFNFITSDSPNHIMSTYVGTSGRCAWHSTSLDFIYPETIGVYMITNYVDAGTVKVKTLRANGTTQIMTPSVDNLRSFTYIRLNTGGNISINNASRINGLFVYNRDMLTSEITYRKNNLLGNELLNVSGLEYYYPLTKAEILIIGGVDKVGCIETVSGNHAEIFNLPAGTLEQKRDWANLNIFEKW